MDKVSATRDKWVCPTDRELVLRSRLQSGWSVKTHSLNVFEKPVGLNEGEQEVIKNVIHRAENIEKLEQERIGRLVEKLENMKKNAIGNGATQCILCADEFTLLKASPMTCYDCRKAVCTKCGVDTSLTPKEPLWLCKICAETREMWKKSGAWFFKSMPKYVIPAKKRDLNSSDLFRQRLLDGSLGSSVLSRCSTWSQGRAALDSTESTDSSDDEMKIPRATVRLSERLYSESDSPKNLEKDFAYSTESGANANSPASDQLRDLV